MSIPSPNQVGHSANDDGLIAASIYDDSIKSPLLGGKDGATTATSVMTDDHDTTSTREAAALKPTKTQLIHLFLIGSATTAAVAATVSAFILVPNVVIVYIAGCICLLISPIVMYKARKLLALPFLSKKVNDLKQTKKLLRRDMKALKEEINGLEAQKRRYDGVERQLQHIALAQGTSIDVIIGLVKDNEDILDLMRDNLRQKVIEDILGIVTRHESSNTMRVDKVEAQLLALKIQVKLEGYGVSFNEDKFLHAVALNPSIWGVIGATRKLLPLDEHHTDIEEEAFESDIYDMFYIRTEDGSIWASTASYASFASGENGISLARRTARRPRFRYDYTSDNLSV